MGCIQIQRDIATVAESDRAGVINNALTRRTGAARGIPEKTIAGHVGSGRSVRDDAGEVAVGGIHCETEQKRRAATGARETDHTVVRDASIAPDSEDDIARSTECFSPHLQDGAVGGIVRDEKIKTAALVLVQGW